MPALAGFALENARKSVVTVDVEADAKRTAVVAPLATPWPGGLIDIMRTRYLNVAVSAAAARPQLASFPRQVRQTFFELRIRA